MTASTTGRWWGACMAAKAQCSILCVGDEAIALFALNFLVETESYRVLSARGEVAAFDLFAHNDIDLVIIDHDHLLTGLTWIELSAEMKRLNSSVPIVLLSAFREIPKDGGHADLFIGKHEELEAVQAKIAALLDRGESSEHAAGNV